MRSGKLRHGLEVKEMLIYCAELSSTIRYFRKNGAILDPNDLITDLLEDRDNIVAIFSHFKSDPEHGPVSSHIDNGIKESPKTPPVSNVELLKRLESLENKIKVDSDKQKIESKIEREKLKALEIKVSKLSLEVGIIYLGEAASTMINTHSSAQKASKRALQQTQAEKLIDSQYQTFKIKLKNQRNTMCHSASKATSISDIENQYDTVISSISTLYENNEMQTVIEMGIDNQTAQEIITFRENF